MKRLLALALVTLTVGGAMAQADYNYVPCRNQLGAFFVMNEWTAENANIDYGDSFFSLYIVGINMTDSVLGYDANWDLPAGVMGLTLDPPPGSFYINIGDAINNILGYAAPQTLDANGNVHLATMSVFPLFPLAGDIMVGPSVPSGIGGDGPTFNIGGEYMRMNFIDLPYNGCNEPSPAVGRVGTLYGGSGPIVMVPVESYTLSGVKALFR